jgi:hypothetical protein
MSMSKRFSPDLAIRKNSCSANMWFFAVMSSFQETWMVFSPTNVVTV